MFSGDCEVIAFCGMFFAVIEGAGNTGKYQGGFPLG